MEPGKQNFSRFSVSMLLGVLVSLLVYPLLIALLPPLPDARWVGPLYKLKDKLLAEIRAPRVIFVGGSNVLYGVDARLFEKATGLPAFNYGMHAGLGFEYMLDRTKQVALAGDVVVLSPEYELLSPYLSNDQVTTTFQAEYLLHYDRDYIFTRPLKETVRLVYGLGPLGLWRELIYASTTVQYPPIDSLGDEMWTDTASKNILKASQPPPPLESLAAPREYLGRFLSAMKARNVRVLFAWPSLMGNPAYRTSGYQKRFLHLKQSIDAIGIPTLGNPEEFFFDRKQVFDTVYHPLNSARRARTLRLAQLICRHDLGLMKCDPRTFTIEQGR